MQIYLIRHGQTISPGTYNGISDIALSKNGESQVVELSRYINTIKFDRCYSSPLKRCRRTYELLDIKNECRLANELKEINFGTWEGGTFDEIWSDDKKNIERWSKEKEMFTFPGGDNILDFSNRVKKWFEKLVVNNYRNVLIISHSGVIRYGICHLLGLDIDRAERFEIKEAHVSMIYSEDGYALLKALNIKG